MDKKDLTTFLWRNLIYTDSKNKFKKPHKKKTQMSLLKSKLNLIIYWSGSNLLRLKGGLIGGFFALILISGIFASSTIALGSLVYAYRLNKKSNSDSNQMQDLETVNV